MFYPELQMPYMPVSEVKKDLARYMTLESSEDTELELAMVCLFFVTYLIPIPESHVCICSLSRWRCKRLRKEP